MQRGKEVKMEVALTRGVSALASDTTIVGMSLCLSCQILWKPSDYWFIISNCLTTIVFFSSSFSFITLANSQTVSWR